MTNIQTDQSYINFSILDKCNEKIIGELWYRKKFVDSVDFKIIRTRNK